MVYQLLAITTLMVIIDSLQHGDFLRWGYPRIIQVDHFRCESHGDLGVPHFKETPIHGSLSRGLISL